MMREITQSNNNTFSNLPLEKRLRIETALVSEFAAKGYQNASLNTVVKALGIAKGSLYQYFSNKEAIFLHIFDHFVRAVKDMVQQPAESEPTDHDFWSVVRRTMLAGVAFVERYPDYYQLYLNVLFEYDIPNREELISQVRLFSLDFFGPLALQGQREGTVTSGVPVSMVVFLIDAALDRFLQGYARSYLDGGLNLAAKDGPALITEIDLLIETLKNGLTGQREYRI
ncbi:MAG: TetR/AcrR family transcriptional regulator [Proteobacteria bacterium]|nr:TetR/AcrR family transcriptional regulator [Desulfobulbaceae bacterium]MBU4151900.1 TetR/AcrR family transcriptional regulator [Pseudomonadota bacterium]